MTANDADNTASNANSDACDDSSHDAEYAAGYINSDTEDDGAYDDDAAYDAAYAYSDVSEEDLSVTRDTARRVVQYVTYTVRKIYTYRGDEMIHEQMDTSIDKWHYTMNAN